MLRNVRCESIKYEGWDSPLQCLVYQTTIYGVFSQQVSIAGDEELLTSASKCHVQLSIHELPVCMGGDREDVQLIRLAYRGAINDDVALAPLVSLYCVDSDDFGPLNAEFF